ncbi:MAG: hypothetical protein IPL08_05450 [Saprospiraceae bacterium]|nr:hypothetical protein [Saprospiraceae bacterium]
MNIRETRIYDEIHTFTQKTTTMSNYLRELLCLPIGALIIVSLGCGGCRVKDGEKKISLNTDTSIENKTSNIVKAKSPIVFPADFPKMNNMPDHIPKGEVIEDIISYEPIFKVYHLFDDDGKYLGKRYK